MRLSLISLLLPGMAVCMSAAVPGTAIKPGPAYQRTLPDGHQLRIYNSEENGKGFVVKYDDTLLGYSEVGQFDVRTAPPALLELLDAYSPYSLSEITVPSASTRGETTSWTSVDPLQNVRGYVTWNQDSPFNDLCPEWSLGQRSPSGCVATAMAQVMYYHQWPVNGTGQHSYEPAILYGNQLSADFANTTYRWDDMLPTYRGGEDEQSCAAVAELMLHCGISVDMVYYSSSGASDIDVPRALTQYFKYDGSIAYRKREHYSSEDWLTVIHSDLSDGLPVLAYGRSSNGGHAFVFDGMDADGLIHVNWGWGGMSNGYFRSTFLTPPAQGIGGADGGFNYSQRIVTGIRPADDQTRDRHIEITSTEGLTAPSRVSAGSTFTLRLSGKVRNEGWQPAQFDYAAVLRDSEGSVVSVFEGPKGVAMGIDEVGYAPSFGSVSFGQFADGEYVLQPCVRDSEGSGEWIPVRDSYVGYPNVLRVTVEGEDIRMSAPDYFALRALDVRVPSTIYSGLPTLIEASVTNEGDVEYHGEVRAVLGGRGTTIAASTSNYIVDIEPGGSVELRFTDGFAVEAGEYSLTLLDDDGQSICAPISVQVEDAPTLGSVRSAAKVEVLSADVRDMKVRANVKSDGYFQGLLYVFVMSESGLRELGCLSPEYVKLENGESAEVMLQGVFENGVPGENYMVQLATYSSNGYTFLGDEDSKVLFTVAGTSGVDEANEDAATGRKCYDFNGFEVDPGKVKMYKVGR